MFDSFNNLQLDRVPLGHRRKPPPPRFGSAAAFVGDQLVVAGGRRGSTCTNTCYSSVDGGRNFTKLESTRKETWVARSHHCLVSVGEVLYVIGGFTEQNEALNDVWCSTNYGQDWDLVLAHTSLADNATMFCGRGYAHAFSTPNGDILVVGGTDLIDCFNDVFRSSDGGRSWSCVRSNENVSGFFTSTSGSSSMWTARFGSWAATNGTQIVLGGGCTLTNDVFCDAYISCDECLTWKRLTKKMWRKGQ